MTTTNGTNGHDPGAHAAVNASRPVVLLRYRPEVVRESARVVHLVPLPGGGQPGAVSALCGTLLRPELVEQVPPGSAGAPCEGCALSHAIEPGVSTPDTTMKAVPEWDPQAGPVAAGLVYRQWGWPVSLRRDQVWLALTGSAVALLVPAGLASTVVPILASRRCPPLVLAHPATPEYRVLLAEEPYPVRLGWPEGLFRVTTQVLLPPTMTPDGPLTWVCPPEPNALRLTREIDICAAIRTAVNPPPPDVPSVF